MEYLGVKFDLKNIPALDPGFIPFGVWMDAYLKDAKMPIAILFADIKIYSSQRVMTNFPSSHCTFKLSPGLKPVSCNHKP